MYQPTYIRGMQTGLVQEREEFILPNDAYPVLQNAFVWRERIKRKQGYELLDGDVNKSRLRRIIPGGTSIGNTGVSPWSFNIFTAASVGAGETNKELQVGSVVIVIGGAITLTDQGDGTLTSVTPGNSGTINYSSGAIVITHTAGAGVATTATFNYFPGLPVMGLRTRETNNINVEQLIAFDQKYAYRYVNGWQEFIAGTTWTGNNSDFFWTTNFWNDMAAAPQKIFWETNFSGTAGDPIRYTNGTAWINFAPQINAAGDVLAQCLAMLPFRGRLVVFNTYEGANLAGSVNYPQRVRWAAIGNPFTTVSAIVATVNANAWREDIPGQGGYLDIPTSEDIISVGFVRDNLVIYCERSTWQLRYTGRSISPFQIEKVNSELGAESTFSAVQFDTSLVGIGDKGIVECNSWESKRIDIKIPDLVFQFNNDNNGTKRVHGIRDFVQRLAYWTYPYRPGDAPSVTYPNRRLVYNYENDSWAIFTDSLTTLGTFQPSTARTWATSKFPWSAANFQWNYERPAAMPAIVGGNQQGFVLYLDSIATNDVSLTITNITGNTTTATVVTSPDHNMPTGTVIKITRIPTGTPFASSLNNQIFGIVVVNANSFQLWKYNSTTQQFTDAQLDAPAVYGGGGKIEIRDNFFIASKKLNFLEEGQNVQLGYIDVLMDNTASGAITLNVYQNYNDSLPINVLPENRVPATGLPDTFFNSVVPTFNEGGIQSDKNWKRVYCSTRGAFLTIVWTLSNAQLVGVEQESDVQIDTQILWMRKAGRQLISS